MFTISYALSEYLGLIAEFRPHERQPGRVVLLKRLGTRWHGYEASADCIARQYSSFGFFL
jgi:hypothetical protein